MMKENNSEKVSQKFFLIKNPLNICAAMKNNTVNKYWWWHTNSIRGL